jgi:hypothetical protein
MKSRASVRFWHLYDALPEKTRRQADKAFGLWLANPLHPGLRFKRIHGTRPIYSVRISREWRALGIVRDDEIVWFWIGSHGDYNQLISRL